jgi:hypothetical protein
MSPGPTDFKRGAPAYLTINEVDQIDLGSDEVMELIRTHNKVFDSLGFIISAGVGIAGHAPPQLGPRTLLPNDATDPRFEVPAEHFPIVIANGGDEDNDKDEEHYRQADPTASPTSRSQASPTIPGAPRKTGTYQLPLQSKEPSEENSMHGSDQEYEDEEAAEGGGQEHGHKEALDTLAKNKKGKQARVADRGEISKVCVSCHYNGATPMVRYLDEPKKYQLAS